MIALMACAFLAPMTQSSAAPAGGTDGELEIGDLDVPLAGWALKWLDYTEGAEEVVCYDKSDVTIYVSFSFIIGNKIFFFGYPYLNYYLQPNPAVYEDTVGHWAYENIRFIAEREAFRGFPDGCFRPNTQMTRAMFATALARMITADLTEYNYRMFDDVDPETWYGPSVAWAYDYGVVEGIGGGKFDPDGSITRQDMLLMIERFLDVFGIDLVTAADDEPFADESLVSFWAAEAVARMRSHSLVEGRPGNLFDPRGFSTRAEVATVLNRLIESAVTEAYNHLYD